MTTPTFSDNSQRRNAVLALYDSATGLPKYIDETTGIPVTVSSVPAPLNLVGGGVEAAALRVTLANDSTGLLSVDDNGGSLTVDGVFWQATQPVSGIVTANLGSIADVATQTTLALINAKTDNIDVASSTLAKESTQLLQPVAATTPTIYNVTMTNADIEYSQALPANTKIVSFRCQDQGLDTRFSFETGKVATPTAPYRNLFAGEERTVEGLNLTGKTLYFACGTAGKVMEIECWV